MVDQNLDKYHGDGTCYIVIYYGVLCNIGFFMLEYDLCEKNSFY